MVVRTMDIPLKQKVDFLRRPTSYGCDAQEVTAIETHVSWVFLVADHVYKLKKPVRSPFLDFTTLSARERNCREEFRLNRRLAPDTYLGIIPLRTDRAGSLRLGGDAGEVVDWLVKMRRLPAERMLDSMLERRAVEAQDVTRLATCLAEFYRRAEPMKKAPSDYIQRFLDQLAADEKVLTLPGFSIDYPRIVRVIDHLRQTVFELRPLLEERAHTGKVVEAHGDLRPEHICLTDPIAIFDCLEFDRELRLLDPMDELAFLGMECTVIDASWLGPDLAGQVFREMEESAPAALYSFYAAFRALLRARLTLSHLVNGDPRGLSKWEPLTDRYTEVAEAYLNGRLEAPAMPS